MQINSGEYVSQSQLCYRTCIPPISDDTSDRCTYRRVIQTKGEKKSSEVQHVLTFSMSYLIVIRFNHYVCTYTCWLIRNNNQFFFPFPLCKSHKRQTHITWYIQIQRGGQDVNMKPMHLRSQSQSFGYNLTC